MDLFKMTVVLYFMINFHKEFLVDLTFFLIYNLSLQAQRMLYFQFNMLTKLSSEKQDDWDDYINVVCFQLLMRQLGPWW